MKAFLKNYRQSPRKVRLIADLIRGEEVEKAEVLLKHSIKNASLPILKLLNSAVSNAKNKGFEKKELKIDGITVNGGYMLKRMMPRARGSAFLIRKRTSHITLNLKSDSLANEKSPAMSAEQIKNKKRKVARKDNKSLNIAKKTTEKSKVTSKKAKEEK